MNKNFALGSLIAVGLLLFAVGSVSPTAPIKIGIVDFQRAIGGEDLAKQIMETLEKDEKSLLGAEQTAQTKLEKDLDAHRVAKEKMAAAAVMKAEQALSQRIETLRMEFGKKREEHAQKIQDKQNDLKMKNNLLVESIARKRGYDLVLPVEVLPYVSESFKKANDITDQLMADFNKAYPVAPPAKTPSSKSDAPAKK
jgi:Skp family chaperone for outer membrane proteins